MTILDRFHPEKHMISILKREYDAIIEMNFDAMSRLAPRKEKALKALSSAQLSREQLEKIQSMSERNQNLLLAASKGIKSVRERLTETRKSAASFRTYDNHGRSHSLARKPLTNE